ncbi:MAG: autotransporter-associated beta strand repeat-containing protein [Verrucomicrobiae bacterium]|nr:autotransporter-associated beta strand repeat-containing protein [Verrucomicrobiae bacterium]
MRKWCMVAMIWAVAWPSPAATNLWAGGTDGAWGTAANWDLDTPFADGNDVEFYALGAGNLTTTLGTNRVVNLLIFNSNAANVVTISGNTLFLLGGVQFDPLSTNHVVSSTINISNFNQTWNLNAGQTFTVGAVNDVGNTVVTVSNGTVLLTANGNLGQWNMTSGATLLQTTTGGKVNDTATSVALDASSIWDLSGFTEALRGLAGAGLVTNYGVGNLDTRPQAGDEFVFSGVIHQTNGGVGGSWVMQGLSTVGTQIFETTLPFYNNIQILNGVGVLRGTNGAAPFLTNVINVGRAEADTPRPGTNAVLVLDSSLGNHVTQDRLPDAEGVFLRSGAELKLVGNDSADTTETISNLAVSVQNEARPHVIVTVDAGTGAGAQLSSFSLNRVLSGGTILFRGDNLGQGPIGPGTSLVTFTQAPTLSDSGTLGTPQAGIIPYALGDTDPNGKGAGFVTYDANGIRLLDASEQTDAFGSGANVWLTNSPTALVGGETELSLKLDGTDITVDLGGNPLALSAGAILSMGPGTNSITNGRIIFGTNNATGYEGVIHALGHTELSASITNNGANAVSLTKSGEGTLTLNARQFYTGRTVIDQGTVVVNGNNFLGTNQLSLDGTLVLTNGVQQAIGMLAGAGSGQLFIGTNGILRIQGGAGDRNYYGRITAPSNADIVKTGANIQSIRADQEAFLGDVFVAGGTWRLIDGNTRMRNATWYLDNGGALDLDNQPGADNQNNSDRLGNTRAINMHRGVLIARGSNNGRSDENVGNINLNGGLNTITLDADETPNTGNLTNNGDIRVVADNLNRNNRSTALLRGDRLGLDWNAFLANSNASSIFDVDATRGTNYLSDQSWTNKGPGSTSLPIVPWLTGGTNTADNGSTFITYQTNFGFRPLDVASEFVTQSFASSGTLDDTTPTNQHLRVQFSGLGTDVTMTNSLSVLGLLIENFPGAANSDNDFVIGDGNTLTVQSGLILAVNTNDNQPTEFLGGTLTFGPNEETGFEGRIHARARMDLKTTIADNIQGGVTNAVSLTVDGGAVYLHSNATYSGETTINAGRLEISGGADKVPTNSVVRINDSGELRLFGGNQTVGGLQGIGFVGSEQASAGRTLTIDITNTAIYDFGGTIRNRAATNGGAVTLIKNGPGTQILSGTNTYSGPTTVNGGSLIAANPLSFPYYSNLTTLAGAMYMNMTANSNGTLAVRGGTLTNWSEAEIDTFRTNATFNPGSYFGIDVVGGQTFTYASDLFNSPLEPLWGFAKSGTGVLNLTGILSMPEDVEVRQGQLNVSGPLVRGEQLRVLDSSTMRFLGPLAIFTNAETAAGSTLIVSNTAGLTIFGTLTNFGTTTFEGETNYIGWIAGEAGTINLRGNYTGTSNIFLHGGADVNFSNSHNQVAVDVLVYHDGLSNSAVSFWGGTNEIFGSIRTFSITNVNPPTLNFFAPRTVVAGDVYMGPSNASTYGAGNLDFGNSEDDFTQIGGDLIIDTPFKRSNTAQEMSRGDVTVASNIIINASGLDFRAFNETNTTTFYGGSRLLIEADFDTNHLDGIGLHDRLVSGTLANGPDGIVIKDFGSLRLDFVRTNLPDAVDYVIGQKITVDNTGPKYWYGGAGEGRVLEVIGDTNIVYGRPGAGDPTIHLTNVWMRDGTFMRLNMSGATARLGITIDGPATNGIATLSDTTGGNVDAFDLLDVRSSSPGLAKVLQIGATNGRLDPDGISYSLDEMPFTNNIRGVSSPDITLDIFNGRLTVDQANGGDVQGSVMVRAGSVFRVGTTGTGTETLMGLMGDGLVQGNVIVSNLLAPGVGVGTLTVNSNVTFLSTAQLNFQLDLGDTTAGGGVNDLLALSGDLALDGVVNVDNYTAGTPTIGDSWTLITYANLAADDGLELGTLPDVSGLGAAWQLSDTGSAILLQLVVPEPSTWALIFTGLGLFAWLGCRRKP